LATLTACWAAADQKIRAVKLLPSVTARILAGSVDRRLISTIIVRFTVRWQYGASGGFGFKVVGVSARVLVGTGGSTVPATILP
jgi:hypothetical protein